MSQVSYGTITINDLTDITDVYLEYALVSDTITRAEDIPSSTQWSTTYPTWVSGQQIWIRRVTRKEGIDTPEYGTPYLDTAVNQIQNNYIGLSNKLRTFFYPGDSTYSGAFAVSKTSTDGLNTANANTYGFNTRVASALISMGYNKIPLFEMGLLGSNFNGIKLYSPILTNNVITGNRLDATLTSEGLKLLKGGIEAGTPNQSGFIYLSTEPYGSYSINSSTDIIDWKEIIGTKFGVREDGTLYASNAVISGQITVGSGSNVYTITEVDEAFESKGSAIEEINKYITSIGDTGIKVHPYNDTTSTVDQNNYTKIDSNGMEIWQEDNNTSIKVAEFGINGIQIGQDNINSIALDRDALKVYDVNGDVVASISETSYFGRFEWSQAEFKSGYFKIGSIKSTNIKKTETFTGNGTRISFGLSKLPVSKSARDATCKIDNVLCEDFTIKSVIPGAGVITFEEAPSDGATIVVTYYTIDVTNIIGAGAAMGNYSTGIGHVGTVSGDYAVAMNYMTVANYEAQTAIGKYNNSNAEYAFIIGNGSSYNSRSNALTVDWSGNVDIASGAKYKINGTNLAPSDLGEVDYIVEQGTNGGWYYRKWNSGRLDADRVWNVGQVTLNTAEGTTHRVGADLTIPTPSMMIGGTVAVTYVGNSSNSPTFMERTASDKVRIAKVITSNVTLQNVTFTLQLVGGTWK